MSEQVYSVNGRVNWPNNDRADKIEPIQDHELILKTISTHIPELTLKTFIYSSRTFTRILPLEGTLPRRCSHSFFQR